MKSATLVGIGQARHDGDHRFRRAEGFPWWTLAWCSDAVRFSLAGRAVRVRGQSLVLIRPRTVYVVEGGSEPWKEVWAFLDPPSEWRELLQWPQRVQGIATLRCAGATGREVRRSMRDGLRLSRSLVPQRERLAAHAIHRVLLLAEALSGASRRNVHPVVSAALSHLERDAVAVTSMAKLARLTGSSVSHLAHVFRQEVGCPPMRHRERVQMARARQLLLSTELAVKAIAAEVGFANPFHFSTRFRAVVGCSPTAFRQQPNGASR